MRWYHFCVAGGTLVPIVCFSWNPCFNVIGWESVLFLQSRLRSRKLSYLYTHTGISAAFNRTYCPRCVPARSKPRLYAYPKSSIWIPFGYARPSARISALRRFGKNCGKRRARYRISQTQKANWYFGNTHRRRCGTPYARRRQGFYGLQLCGNAEHQDTHR